MLYLKGFERLGFIRNARDDSSNDPNFVRLNCRDGSSLLVAFLVHVGIESLPQARAGIRLGTFRADILTATDQLLLVAQTVVEA